MKVSKNAHITHTCTNMSNTWILYYRCFEFTPTNNTIFGGAMGIMIFSSMIFWVSTKFHPKIGSI